MSSERKNITQPSAWWVAFSEQAERQGMSLSEWVGAACLEALPKAAQKKLDERGTVGRPKIERSQNENDKSGKA